MSGFEKFKKKGDAILKARRDNQAQLNETAIVKKEDLYRNSISKDINIKKKLEGFR